MKVSNPLTSCLVCICLLSLLPFDLNIEAQVLSAQQHASNDGAFGRLRSLLTLVPLNVWSSLVALQIILVFVWVYVHGSGTYIGPGANDESDCTYRSAPKYFSIPVLVFLYLACFSVALIPPLGCVAHDIKSAKDFLKTNSEITIVIIGAMTLWMLWISVKLLMTIIVGIAECAITPKR